MQWFSKTLESADQDNMGRRWAARSLLVAGLAAVVVTAGLGQTEKIARTRLTPTQPVAGHCVGTGMKQVCISGSTQAGGPEACVVSGTKKVCAATASYMTHAGYNSSVSVVPGSTNAQGYCISAISDGHWAYVGVAGGQLKNDPAATTDPCERPNG